MKLVIAIVNDEDSGKLMSSLTKEGFGATKLASSGGFLKAGNTTVFVGVEKEKVDNVIEIIKKSCKARKQTVTAPIPNTWSTGVYMQYPVEVNIGGATVFVVDVERFEKV